MSTKHIHPLLSLVLCLALIGFGAAFATSQVFGEDNSEQPVIPEDQVNNGIPVLSLSMDEDEYQQVIESPDHSYEGKDGVLSIKDQDGSVLELSLDYIRGRGNSTWRYPKKPFKIKLNESADLFGMGDTKHWVLLANTKDQSLLRNQLMSYMGLKLGMEYTPQMIPVDFVVNGEYKGSYSLCPQVRIGGGSVEEPAIDKTASQEADISGGYLVALEPKASEEEINKFTTERGVNFFLDDPDFSENRAREQRDYITGYLQKTENAIFGQNFCDEAGNSYMDYMDIDSAARYWWVQEFSCNVDAFWTPSTYLYKKKDGKLCWGPLWDFDGAYYDTEAGGDLNTSAQMPWLDHMRAYDGDYQAALRESWKKFDKILADFTTAGGDLDKYADQIKASWEMDHRIWGHEGDPTFEESIEELRTFIDSRRTGINKDIENNLDEVYHVVSFIVDDKRVKRAEVKFGMAIAAEAFPEDPVKEGYRFTGWRDEEGNKVIPGRTFEHNIEAKAIFVPENGIPVVELNIDPEEFQSVIDSDDHSYRARTGNISIDVPDKEGGYTNEFSAGVLEDQPDLPLEYIRGRGNSTWQETKKPFKFKLQDSTSLLGMGKNKHWVLLANGYDDSLLRNRISMYIGRQLGMPFTPKMVPVDLVVNGEYAGSYMLSEQVRIGKNRVGIDELEPTDKAEPEVTGGYLLGLEPYNYELKENTFETSRKLKFKLDTPIFASEDPDEEVGPKEQRDYITGYLQKTEDAIFGEDQMDEEGVSYTDYMDMESAVKYWWVQEFSGNGDAFATPSTYLYKARGGKLFWGPLWDFDLAYFSGTSDGSIDHTQNIWLDRLRGYDPEYQKQVRAVWDDLDEILADMTRKGGVFDQYASEISASWQMNHKIWPQEDEITYDQAIDTLRDYIDERRAGIAQDIDEKISRVFVKYTFMDGDKVLETLDARIGGMAADLPRDPVHEGEVFLGWETEDGQLADFSSMAEEDSTFYARFVKPEDMIQPEEIYFVRDEFWHPLDDNWQSVSYHVVPDEAEKRDVSWESSDEEIAKITDEGIIRPASAGTVKFTATTQSGLSRSVTCHIYDPNETVMNTPETIETASESLMLTPAAYGQMKWTLGPTPCTGNVIMETSDSSVAEILDCNVIRGVSPGTCTITVEEADSGVKTEFTVTVEDNSEEIVQAKGELAQSVLAAVRDLGTGHYTEESFKALKRAIQEANAVIDDPAATMRQIEYAQSKLLRKHRRLEPIDQAAAAEEERRANALDALDGAVSAARSLDLSGYKASSLDAFHDAVAAAAALIADPSATSDQMNKARSAIISAKSQLVAKAANPLTVKTKTLKVKAKKKGKKKVVKKTKNFAPAKAFVVGPKGAGTASDVSAGSVAAPATGKVSFSKKNGNKKITISSAGKVTVKKGLKKGTYKVKVQVKAAGDDNTLPATKVVTLKVKVK